MGLLGAYFSVAQRRLAGQNLAKADFGGRERRRRVFGRSWRSAVDLTQTAMRYWTAIY